MYRKTSLDRKEVFVRELEKHILLTLEPFVRFAEKKFSVRISDGDSYVVLVNIPGISLSLHLSFSPSLPQLRTTRVRSTGETVKIRWSLILSSPNTYPQSTTPQRSTPLPLPPTEGRPSCLASCRSTLPMAVALRGSRQDQGRLSQLSKLCYSRDFSLFFPPCLSVSVCVFFLFLFVVNHMWRL